MIGFHFPCNYNCTFTWIALIWITFCRLYYTARLSKYIKHLLLASTKLEPGWCMSKGHERLMKVVIIVIYDLFERSFHHVWKFQCLSQLEHKQEWPFKEHQDDLAGPVHTFKSRQLIEKKKTPKMSTFINNLCAVICINNMKKIHAQLQVPFFHRTLCLLVPSG